MQDFMGLFKKKILSILSKKRKGGERRMCRSVSKTESPGFESPRPRQTNDTEEQALLRNSMVEFLTSDQDVAGSTPAKRPRGRSVRLPALFVCFFVRGNVTG